MDTVRVKNIFELHVKSLPAIELRQLIALARQDLEDHPAVDVVMPKRSIMELHGLGADSWRDIDAQEYIKELREEWDHRP